MRYLLFAIVFVSCVLASPPFITHLKIEGTVSPASSSYLKEAFVSAKENHASLVLMELDTPGGLSSSMREMIRAIVNSPVPVVVYVSPKGAHAASAGTYLLYAAHIAAMSPGTNLGAATPISMIQPPKMVDANISIIATAEKKALSDAMAYIKSLAQLRDRNATWALQAVKEAKSLSAEDALRCGVIDLIADDRDDLLAKLEGMRVTVAQKEVVLHTRGAIVNFVGMDWKTQFLSVITNPNIAYIFLLLGLYGIFFELINPGSIFPGVIGVISGIIALYALNLLPFNYAGLLLILLGIALMVAEVFVAGFGILGIGGVIAFAFGSLLLFDAQTIGSGVSIPLVLAFSLVSLAFFILSVQLLLRSRSAKIVSGSEEMIGAVGEVLETTTDGYRIRCHGEVWYARSDTRLHSGQHVQVESISGLILHVIPYKE